MACLHIMCQSYGDVNWVNLYEPENEWLRDHFTGKRIAGACINIESGAAESILQGWIGTVKKSHML